MLNCVYSFAIGLLLTVLTEGVDGCGLNAIDKAAVVGDDISVTCRAVFNVTKVLEWRYEGPSGFLIFRAAHIDYNTGNVDASIRDGYSVDSMTNPLLLASTLTIKNVKHSNAGGYSCQCAEKNSVVIVASAILNIVIVSIPTFSTTTALSDGGPITFSCNVSFSGIANSSIEIEDLTKYVFTSQNYAANSIDLHNFILPYDVKADSSLDQTFWCNVALRNDSSSTEIYSTKLNVSVQWTPVRNAKITGNENCVNGGQCAVGEAVLCSAEGNPKPTIFNWTMSVNGSEFIQENVHGEQLTLANIGQYKIRCTAFNKIKATSYNSTSDIFTTQVVVDGPNYASARVSNNTALIIGLVVGLGGSIIILTIIIAFVFMFCKRKKRQQNKPEVYTTLDLPGSATSGMSQQDTYTELQTAPVDHEQQNSNRVSNDDYETRIDFNGAI